MLSIFSCAHLLFLMGPFAFELLSRACSLHIESETWKCGYVMPSWHGRRVTGWGPDIVCPAMQMWTPPHPHPVVN